MMTPTEQYKYDNKFRQIVDILRDELRHYEFTPSELRQAVILAATIHADQNIRPIYIDEAKRIPSMFGHIHDFKYTGRGYDVCDCGISSVYYSATKSKTATGSNL